MQSRRVPELDGVRGLAVAAVVAYHAWPDTVPGGWLGVSVFFTLSGFLITGILIRDHEPTRSSLAAFWLTRARRLLPAALTVILAALVGTMIVDPDSVRRVAGDALASIGYVQNWREAAAPGGYGAIFDTGIRPLAHMWSLAIEEQVYVVLPLLTLWLGPRRMLAVAGALAVGGTVFWWGSPDAYYATPVRLVEVLAGAALAIAVAEGRRIRLSPLVGLAAGAALIAGVFTLGESHDLVSRGVLPAAALLSAAVLAVLIGHDVAPLTVRPLLWLGHRSYAIYLIHWPLLVLLDVPPIVAVVATIVLAEISHHLIEWPIRSRRVLTVRPARAFVLATLAAVAVTGTALAAAPRPASDAEIAAATAAALQPAATTSAPPVARVVDDEPSEPVEVVEPAEPVPDPEPEPEDPRIPIPEAPTVMVVGESTAEAIEPAVAGWVGVIGGESIDATELGCSPMFTPAGHQRWHTMLIPSPDACREPVRDGTDLVLVVDHGVPLFDHFDRESDIWLSLTDAGFVDAMVAEYEQLIDEAAAAGARVAFTSPPTPWPAFGEWPEFHTGTEKARRSQYQTMIEDLADRHGHVHMIELGSVVDADPDRYPRSDGMHLDGDTGAVNAVVDVIAPAFRFEPS